VNDLLEPVFENGVLLRQDTFDAIRSRAEAAWAAELQAATA